MADTPTPAVAPVDKAAQKRALAALTPAQLAVAALVEIVCEASDDPDPGMVDTLVSVARRRLAAALRALDRAEPAATVAPAPAPRPAPLDIGRAIADIARAGAGL